MKLDEKKQYKKIENQSILHAILEEVSTFTNVTATEIVRETRKRETLIPRQLCQYFLKEYSSYSLAEIGFHVGKKDHATVINSRKTIKNLVETNRKFEKEFRILNQIIRKRLDYNETDLYFYEEHTNMTKEQIVEVKKAVEEVTPVAEILERFGIDNVTLFNIKKSMIC